MQKLVGLGYSVVKVHDHSFNCLWLIHPLTGKWTDRQTDGRTDVQTDGR